MTTTADRARLAGDQLDRFGAAELLGLIPGTVTSYLMRRGRIVKTHAARYGITPAQLEARVAANDPTVSEARAALRGRFPAPDGHMSRSPWWYRDTLERWDRTTRVRKVPNPDPALRNRGRGPKVKASR